jgi:hypothetical protein
LIDIGPCFPKYIVIVDMSVEEGADGDFTKQPPRLTFSTRQNEPVEALRH